MNSELHRIHKELNAAARDIPKTLQAVDGWAARVMKTLHINEYADFPKRSNRTNF